MPSEFQPKQDASSLFKRPNYETQGNRLSFRDICGYATVLWPPVPDVVMRTLGLMEINCTFTDEFMHRNTRRSSRSKAVVERAPGICSTSAHKKRERRPRTVRRAFSSAKEGSQLTENYTGVKIHIGALRRPRGAQPRFQRPTEPLSGYISP